jgi:thiamine pyrophosphokinase
VPTLVVGDADSLAPADLARLRESGVPIELSPAAKDASDLELALLAAIERGATRLTILGALGGKRLDHALANVGLLAHPALEVRAAALLDATSRVTLLRAPADGSAARRPLPGRVGDLVTLLPLGEGVDGVTTHGLAYPLRDEPLFVGPARGLSNVRTAADAAVSLRRGLLLIIETAAPGGSCP